MIEREVDNRMYKIMLKSKYFKKYAGRHVYGMEYTSEYYIGKYYKKWSIIGNENERWYARKINKTYIKIFKDMNELLNYECYFKFTKRELKILTVKELKEYNRMREEITD